jgi:4a-hydroxytetrahydrobiopterin dehydratase
LGVQQLEKGVDVSALSKAEIHEQLKTLPGWSHAGKSVHRKFTFKSFMAGIGFVNKIAEAAEKAQHHPDITINYSVVTISLSTHSEGGVTARDFELARQIDAIADASM